MMLLYIRPKPRFQIEVDLGVTQDDCTTTYVHEVDHGPKRRLQRVVIAPSLRSSKLCETRKIRKAS